jgi:MSHA biogenesis protein MshO
VISYFDTAARAEMADVAEVALRRMAREVHGALPNSIHVTVIGNTSYLEFIPTITGGAYLAVEDGADPSLHPPLRFGSAGNQFEIVTPLPAAPYPIAAGNFVVVSNYGPGFVNGDAYAGNNRAGIAGVGTAGNAMNNKSVTLDNTNPFPAQDPANPSPGKRFQIVGTPVIFACVNDATGRGALTRIWGYGWGGFDPAQQNNNIPQALMANNVLGCQFSVATMAHRQAALVGLSIALARSNPDGGGMETVTLTQQIHVDNTP